MVAKMTIDCDIRYCDVITTLQFGYNRQNCEVKMKTPLRLRSVFGLLLSIPILVLICAPVYAQWVKVPTGSIPRGPDGKPNLLAPAPRLPDGRPDLSGVWEPNGNKYVLDI